MTMACAVALRALGIQVVVDDSQRSEEPDVPLVHIFNHRSACDGIVIQGILKFSGLTTAQLHLKWVLRLRSSRTQCRRCGTGSPPASISP